MKASLSVPLLVNAASHAFFVFAMVLSAAPAIGGTASDRPARGEALVIGIGASGSSSPIPNVDLDAKEVGTLLDTRGDYQVYSVVATGSRQISGEDLLAEIQAWRNQIRTSARRVFFYYRGRLRLDTAGRLVLVGSDVAPGTARSPGVLVSTVLQSIGECRDGVPAVVMLDVATDVQHKELAGALSQAMAGLKAKSSRLALVVAPLGPDHIVTKDTCRSPVCREVCAALRGAADSDGNRSVTVGEVSDYLEEQLAGTSDVLILNTNPGVTAATLLDTRPVKLDEVLTDLAVELSSDLHKHKAQLVAVPDFRVDIAVEGNEGVPGKDYGPLMKYCVAKLKKEIASRSNFRYRIVDGSWLRKLLNRHKISPNNIESPRMKMLSEELRAKLGGTGTVTLVVGALQHLGGSKLSVVCTPWSADDGAAFNLVRKEATLNPSEWAMIGTSAVNTESLARFTGHQPTASEHRAPAAAEQVVSRDTSLQDSPFRAKPHPLLDFFDAHDLQQIATEIDRLERRSTGPHPMADPNFPYKVYLEVKNARREAKWSADLRHLYYELQDGDQYVIHIQNNSNRPVFMRLLVDGLNTLPDHPMTRTEQLYEVAVKDASLDMLPAQYINLTNANAWRCEPGRYAVAGFYTNIDRQGSGLTREAEQAEFKVTDAASSEAWRQGYTKDVGIITAAFYAPTDRPEKKAVGPRFGTALGKRSKTRVHVYNGAEVPGELLVVEHIRYGIVPGDED